MKIRMNQDIDNYEESVLFGFTARQLFFSAASLLLGAGLYLLCRPYLGSVLACYVVAVAVAPLALAGFYHLHDMGFLEVLRRFVLSFFAKPLLYETAVETKEGAGKKKKEKTGRKKVSLFGSRFKLYKKAEEPLYQSPKRVQETIEIKRIARNGIFELRDGLYSKGYLFTDINYATLPEEKKEEVLEKFCQLLNALDVRFEITILNRRQKEEEKEVQLLASSGDGFDSMRNAYNEVILENSEKGRKGLVQERLITLTVERKTYADAKSYFNDTEATLKGALQNLGSSLFPLNARERLTILYDLYHTGEDVPFAFDFDTCIRERRDYVNDLCNSRVKYGNDLIELDRHYAKAFYIKTYPYFVPDSFLNAVVDLPVEMLFSIHVSPIQRDVALKTLQAKYVGIENDILRQQQKRNKNHDFSTDISYIKRKEKEEIEETMDDVRENDENVFYVGVTIVLFADTKESLLQAEKNLEIIAKGSVVQICAHYLKQREAFVTALPLGLRLTETMRTMLSQSAACLAPFHVQELTLPDGVRYGMNQVSKNLIRGNRKKLLNGNGMVLAVTGAGKSFFTKYEIGQVLLESKDSVIIIDPHNEYASLCRMYGGTFVDVSNESGVCLNPLFVPQHIEDPRGFLTEKGELMHAFCEQCMEHQVDYRKKSLIDRVLQMIFTAYFEGSKEQEPTLSDFYKIMKAQREQEAKDIALALERYTDGIFRLFDGQMNVDREARFLVYGIRELGKELSPLAMLLILASIEQKIMENHQKGIATWLYIDECHLLLDSPLSAKFMLDSWKKIRKFGGLATGITSNIIRVLNHPEFSDVISNSEFVVLLKQPAGVQDRLQELLGISREEFTFVERSEAGCGLLKHGNALIPFDLSVEKSKELYRMYSTNFHEGSRWDVSRE